MARSKLRVEALDALAREMVGDDQSPDLFFVSVVGAIDTVTVDFDLAYARWLTVSTGNAVETALENRQFGVIASVEPESDESSRLVRRNDRSLYLHMRRKRRPAEKA